MPRLKNDEGVKAYKCDGKEETTYTIVICTMPDRVGPQGMPRDTKMQ